MINRKKDILKRNYIAPKVYFELTEPMGVIAASMQGSNMGGGGNTNPFGPPPQQSKENTNLFFYDDTESDFYEDEIDE